MANPDWIFLAILGLSTLWGLWRGLASELLGLLSWVAAFVLAQWFGETAGGWLPLAGAPELLRFSAGFVLVFVLSIVAGSVLAFVLKSALSAAGLGPADRALGAVFGAGRGMLLLHDALPRKIERLHRQEAAGSCREQSAQELKQRSRGEGRKK